MSAGAIVATVGGCAVLTALVISSVVVMYRRFHQPTPGGPAFSSLSQSVPPEDVHITSMQMTGYENPTYRFFEKKGNSSA
jgi:Beta-amyloid precursor protein C-terminus